MQLLRILQVLPLAGSTLVAGSIHYARDGTATQHTDTTNQFIVEVEKGADVQAVADKLTADTDAKVVKTFESDVFTGFTIETTEYNLDTLNLEKEVKQAWTATFVPLPELGSTTKAGRASQNANYSLHWSTGVDKAHAAGIFGQGVKVAIVDTGIDYNHPALGGGFGPGFKVSGGYDLVGDVTGQLTNPDDDPRDYEGHGTHVAGIVAGKTDWYTGVAPEAELLAYKVFSGPGGTWDTYLIDSFLMAYNDGADVITASIGGAGGWSNGAWATVASRIAENGVIVTISASNDGEAGAFYGSSGSSGKEVLAIASSKASTLVASPFELVYKQDGKTEAVRTAYRYNYNPWEGEDLPIRPLFLDTTRDGQACTPEDIPADTPDLSNTVILVRRTKICDYLAQEFNLRAFNVSRVMFYNDKEQSADDPFSWLSGPKALVDTEVGLSIIDTVKAGGSVTGNFEKYKDADYYVGIFNGAGGRPSQFTSWGGLFDMDLKPEVSAPGGEILSSWPDSGWRVASGTSMACPYAAGVAALYLSHFGGREVHGKNTAKLFRQRIVASGRSMPWNTKDVPSPVDTGFWAPTIQAGSGLLNAWSILNYTSTLDTTKFLLNDTAHFRSQHSVNIKNSANVEVEYRFELQAAAGIEAQASSGLGFALLGQLSPVKMVPGVVLPSGSFKIAAGSTKKASFTFSVPTGLNVARQPLYSGKILITSSLGEQLSVPYFGAGYSLREHFKDIFTPDSPSSYTKDFPNRTTFSFDVKKKEPVSNLPDYFTVFAGFLFGCDELRWDIYQSGWQESRWQYPPVVGQNGYIGSATMWRDSGTLFDPQVNDPEDTVPFPQTSLIRSIYKNQVLGWTRYRFHWFGKLADNTYIKPGKYKMRFAALRPFGDRTKAADWDVWTDIPDITVVPKSSS